MNVAYVSHDRVGQTPAAAAGSNSLSNAWVIASTVAVPLSAYHGYARTQSVGWAIGWGLLGGLFPFITVPIAFAQGFGKRA